MSVDIRGNVFCDVCGIKIFNGIPHANRKIGNDGYAMCSQPCVEKFEIIHAASSEKITAAMEEDERKGADEQRGWKVARWWNQQYKHRRKAYDQWNTEREFKRIQRQARRKVK